MAHHADRQRRVRRAGARSASSSASSEAEARRSHRDAVRLASRWATGGSLSFLFHSSHGGIACATVLAATATTTAVLATAKQLFLPGHKRDCRRRRLTPGPLKRGPPSYLLTATCTDAAGVAGALLLANERLARLCRGVTGGHCSREPSENETG